MRITKDAEERKSEILDIAQRLFHEKGYVQTTIEDILRESGIARGTLYYHFKSKEDILSAMIDRQIDRLEQEFRCIAEDSALSAVEKLVRVIQLQSHSGMLAEGLHEKENAELHQKSFQRSLLRYTPVLTEIVEQGIESGEFSTPYPKESVELLFCASQLHDPGVFSWPQEERQQKKKAFFWMLEVTLGISPEAKERLYRLAGLSPEQVV
ncbi:MAG: TetR/AcrR family transcriptional regulator [Oscillospiraceae bacterium]|nr:TetR/AcrR family transcriptional regulator [Oscillospiraceae bacterium]